MIGGFFAGLAVAAGVLGTLTMLVMCLAGAPNSSPPQIRRIKQIMLLSAVLGAAMAAGGIWLIVQGHPWWAALVGGFPMIFVTGGIVYLSLPRR
jgi:hypothetical protein